MSGSKSGAPCGLLALGQLGSPTPEKAAFREDATCDPVHPSRKPSWISTPLPGPHSTPGDVTVGEAGVGWDSDDCHRMGSRAAEGVMYTPLQRPPPPLARSVPGPVCLGRPALTPPPGPHLELAPQVGHLIQPMLLYAPVAAPPARVSAPFRFHLGGGPATRGSGPGQLGGGMGVPTHCPDEPSVSPNTSLWEDGRQACRPSLSTHHLLSSFFQVSAPLPPPTGSPPRHHMGSDTLPGLSQPLWTPHHSPFWLVTVQGQSLSCTELGAPGGPGQVVLVTTGSPALPRTGPGPVRERVLKI